MQMAHQRRHDLAQARVAAIGRDAINGAVALAAAVTIGHGACVEVLQAFVPWREASLGDLAAARRPGVCRL